jgi:hypothetical protein
VNPILCPALPTDNQTLESTMHALGALVTCCRNWRSTLRGGSLLA